MVPFRVVSGLVYEMHETAGFYMNWTVEISA
jgi:hypothetical protein